MNKSNLKTAVDIADTMIETFNRYSQRLQQLLATMDWHCVEALCQQLLDCQHNNRQVFLCGNGGSAGNAMHIANDLIYGAGGLRVEALPANPAVLTCLANDIGYDEIYARQLIVKGNKDDLLIVLSGSGNSANIIRAVEAANSLGMKTAGILGYDGGRCRTMVGTLLHTPINDMQISEDMQLIVGHMIMQWFSNHPVKDVP